MRIRTEDFAPHEDPLRNHVGNSYAIVAFGDGVVVDCPDYAAFVQYCAEQVRLATLSAAARQSLREVEGPPHDTP